MAGPVDLLREVMSLTTNVGSLQADVSRILDKVENHADRITRLECREETLVERMSKEAVIAVSKMTSEFGDRLRRLES